MKITIQCWSKDTGINHDTKEPYTQALFLDVDPEDKLGAFLKMSGEDCNRVEVGKTYDFSLTGLSPAKGDKSSYYIQGRVRNEHGVAQSK